MISLSRKTGLRAINAKKASPLLPSKLIESMHPNPMNISIRKARFKFLYFMQYYVSLKVTPGFKIIPLFSCPLILTEIGLSNFRCLVKTKSSAAF